MGIVSQFLFCLCSMQAERFNFAWELFETMVHLNRHRFEFFIPNRMIPVDCNKYCFVFYVSVNGRSLQWLEFKFVGLGFYKHEALLESIFDFFNQFPCEEDYLPPVEDVKRRSAPSYLHDTTVLEEEDDEMRTRFFPIE